MVEASDPAIIERLAALAHDARFGAFRLLVRAGPEGLPAGQVAERLELGATAASFHLNRLRTAGLVTRRRLGAKMIYTADFAAMRNLRDFLDTECCAETEQGCTPSCGTGPQPVSPTDQTRPFKQRTSR